MWCVRLLRLFGVIFVVGLVLRMKMFDPLRLSEMMDDGELWSLPQRVTDDEEADIRETLENLGKLLLSRKDVIHNNGAAITEQLRGLEACLKKATTDSWNPVALFWMFFRGGVFFFLVFTCLGLRDLDLHDLMNEHEHGPFCCFVWSFFRGRVFGLCFTCLGLCDMIFMTLWTSMALFVVLFDLFSLFMIDTRTCADTWRVFAFSFSTFSPHASLCQYEVRGVKFCI